MPKPDPLREASEKAARLAYFETELSERGEETRALWESDAQEWVEDELDADLWASAAPAVGRLIRRTEGVLPGINGYRAQEELPPLTDDEDVLAYLLEEPWSLELLGRLEHFRITVWSHPEFDGALACAVAEDVEEELALATMTCLA